MPSKPKQQETKSTQQEALGGTRRKIIIAGAAITAIPALKNWGKPVINSVLLPAHAQTSGDTAPPPPPPPPPPPAAESFSLSVAAPNGPLSQGAEFFVMVDGGTFTISIFTDGENTDLGSGISNATATAVGVNSARTIQGCGNDGSLGPAVSSQQGIQVVSYTPGVNVVLQFQGDGMTFTVPLNNNAVAPICPIL